MTQTEILDLQDQMHRARGVVRCLCDFFSVKPSLDDESCQGVAWILERLEDELKITREAN